MTQPTSIGGRPFAPAPGTPAPELRIAHIRPHARRLFWSVLVLWAVAGACGYLYGNLPGPWQDWQLLTAAAVIVFLLVLVPYLRWWTHSYTITTRRVIERRGMLRIDRHEVLHVRGYSIHVRRGILQRIWGAGTLTLSNGVDTPLRLRNIPSVSLVHETLVDQVEVSQILAHREAPATNETDVVE